MMPEMVVFLRNVTVHAAPLRVAVFRAAASLVVKIHRSCWLLGRRAAILPTGILCRSTLKQTRVLLQLQFKQYLPLDTGYAGSLWLRPLPDARGTVGVTHAPSSKTPPLEVAVFRAGNKTTYRSADLINLAARGTGGSSPYRYQYYLIRSNGVRSNLTAIRSSNIASWRPSTPGTYTLGVVIRDKTGAFVRAERKISVLHSVMSDWHQSLNQNWTTISNGGASTWNAAGASGTRSLFEKIS